MNSTGSNRNVCDNYSVWPLGETHYDSDRPWPGISIVTPNYNGAERLPATVESVLRQNYPNLQYAILDGGSTDGSRQVIERYADRLHYWHSRPDQGQYSAINTGFAQTSAEICGWLNSDDQYLPWTLHTVGAIFRDLPEVGWLSGIPCIMQQGIIHSYPSWKSGYCRELIQAGCYDGRILPFIQQESCFWRRSLWDTVGGLDQEYSLAADFNLWTRFAQHSNLVFAHIFLAAFHQTGENRSQIHRDQYLQEVGKCISRLPSEAAALRRRVQRYQRVSNLPLVRKSYRIFSGLNSMRCVVVLQTNGEQNQFELREVPLGF